MDRTETWVRGVKALGLATVLTVALPVSALAATITGQIDIVGTVNLDTSDFVVTPTTGNVDLNPLGFVLIADGDFSSVLGSTALLYDIDLKLPGIIWEVGDFTFTAESFSGITEYVPGISSNAFNAAGVISGNGFDDTLGALSFTAQDNAVTVSFSSTTLPAPVPLPAAAWLFGSALIGVGMLGNRMKKA